MGPKGWVTAVGALAAYTTTEDEMWWKTSVIAGVLAAACFVSVVVWAGFGAAMRRFLQNSRIRTVFNWSMASLLVISLIPVFW